MSGRVGVVTGANRGIGREVAAQLAATGDIVILTARDHRKARTPPTRSPGRAPGAR